MSSSPIDLRQQRNGRLRDKLRRELGADVLAALADPTVVEVMLNAHSIPVYRVSRWLGHANSKVTEDVCEHWIPPPDENGAVDQLDHGGPKPVHKPSHSDFRVTDEEM